VRSRRKTLLLAAALGIAFLTAAAAWFARDALLERWWIHRLSSDAPEVRAAMAERLGRSGGDAAARALAERVVADGEGGDKDAVAALEAVFERVRPETRVWVTRKLVREIKSFEIVHARPPEIDSPIAKLLALASTAPETLGVFVEGLEHNPDDLLCLTVLASTWSAARERVKAWFVRTEPARLEAFLEALYSTLDADVGHLDSGLARVGARQAMDDLARAHPMAEVRAIALVKAAFAAQNGSGGDTDPGNIARVLAGDQEPIVRTTALKLAGVFGGRDNAAHLKTVLLAEKDPGILATAIEARTLAALEHDAFMLLVAPGVTTRLHSVDRARFPVQPFDGEEVLRLESILLEARDPPLRDAASRALAIARSGGAGEPQPERVESGLEVREWSVWKEEGAPVPPGDETNAVSPDLPPFVPRTQPGFEHLARSRVDPALPGRATVRSAVFFHAPRPLTLTVRAACLGGVPQCRYPEATNLFSLESAGTVESRVGVVLEGHAAVETAIDPAGAGYWGHDRNFSPQNGFDPAAPWHALDSIHQFVPWARSGASLALQGPRGFGLEWKGLRAGYGQDLEGDLCSLPPEAKPSSWAIARKAGSTPVAIGGYHERFLFHEGPALAPSPIVVEWADRARQALLVRTRDFLSLPHLHDWEDRDYRSLRGKGERIVPATAHVPAVLVVRKDAGKPSRGACLRNLPSRSPTVAVALDRLDLDGAALAETFRATLEGEGLTREDSEGFLAAWEEKLLQAEGLRVLTVLPRWLHDALLPLEITPLPEKTTRVGILWRECDALEARARSGNVPADLFGPAEPLEIEVSTLDTRREPLEPGPAMPFEILEDGLLDGIWPGADSMLFAEDGRFFAHPKDGLKGIEIHIGDLEKRELTMAVRLPPPLFLDDYTICADGSRAGMLVLDGMRYRLLIAELSRGALVEAVKDFGSLAWIHSSRDGRLHSFLEDGEPRLLDLETNELRRIRLPRGAKAFYPMLTPSGGTMALILETTVKEEDGKKETKRAEIALLDMEGRTLRRLAKVSGAHQFPSISPDGKKVLFTRGENGFFWLYLADLEGSRLLRISPHAPGVHTRGLSGDGSTVFFTEESGIWATDLRTGASRLAHESRGFRIRDGGISLDGRKAFLLGAHPRTGRVTGLYHVDLEPE
jgi:hypothetical protein